MCTIHRRCHRPKMQVVPRGNAEELSQWFLGFSYLNRQRWPLPPLKSTGCLVVFNLIVKSLFSATRCLAWLLGGWVSGYQVLVLQGSGNPQKLQLVIEERGEDQKIPCAGFRKVLTNILQDFRKTFCWLWTLTFEGEIFFAFYSIHVEGERLYKDKNPGWNFPEKFVTILERRRSKYTQDPCLY